MPTYDYACGRCGGFEAMRPYAQRDEPLPCPDCTAPAPRVWTAMPRLARLDGATRLAMETNERARHAPRSSADDGAVRLRHPAGCGCCSNGRRGATVTAANGAKAFRGKRPWMISH